MLVLITIYRVLSLTIVCTSYRVESWSWCCYSPRVVTVHVTTFGVNVRQWFLILLLYIKTKYIKHLCQKSDRLSWVQSLLAGYRTFLGLGSIIVGPTKVVSVRDKQLRIAIIREVGVMIDCTRPTRNFFEIVTTLLFCVLRKEIIFFGNLNLLYEFGIDSYFPRIETG